MYELDGTSSKQHKLTGFFNDGNKISSAIKQGSFGSRKYLSTIRCI